MWVLPMIHASRATSRVMMGAVLVLLIVCHLREGVSLREVGIRFDNFWRALKQLAVPIGLCAALLLATGFWAGSLRPSRRFLVMALSVPPWGFLQQMMLLGFANRRLRVIFRQGRGSVIATAVLFGLFHLPNPMLTLACAISGYIWADQFERNPNLFATALTHGVASSCLANSLPRWLLSNLRVGFGYFLR
jgi:hypothetical protein